MLGGVRADNGRHKPSPPPSPTRLRQSFGALGLWRDKLPLSLLVRRSFNEAGWEREHIPSFFGWSGFGICQVCGNQVRARVSLQRERRKPGPQRNSQLHWFLATSLRRRLPVCWYRFVSFSAVHPFVRLAVWAQVPFDGLHEPERYTPLLLSRAAAHGTFDASSRHFPVFFSNERTVHHSMYPVGESLLDFPAT